MLERPPSLKAWPVPLLWDRCLPLYGICTFMLLIWPPWWPGQNTGANLKKKYVDYWRKPAVAVMSSSSSTSFIPLPVPVRPRVPSMPATFSSLRWPEGSCGSWVPPRRQSIESISKRTEHWSGDSSRSMWESPIGHPPWPFCVHRLHSAAAITASRPEKICWGISSACVFVICPTAISPTKPSTCWTKPRQWR